MFVRQIDMPRGCMRITLSAGAHNKKGDKVSTISLCNVSSGGEVGWSDPWRLEARDWWPCLRVLKESGGFVDVVH